MARRAKRVKLSRAQQLENELNHNLAKKDALLASLVKVMIKLKSLQRSQVRMQKAALSAARSCIEEKSSKPEALVDDLDDIPAYLQRNPKDEAARAEIEAAQAAEKKAKTERRLKKLKIGQEIKTAELTGQRRRMPLSGRDALKAILQD